jgi:predicted flap endonuclease-1-like 5' DNA nuclease
MIILQVTPLSQNFWMAGFEAIALLAVAAYIGWWLGRRTLAVKIEGLHADIRARRVDLNDCQKSKSSVAVAAASMPTAATVPVTSLAAVPIVPVVPDDLKIVEGIGPKIEGVLNKEGILTFAQLAATEPERIKEILHAAGPRFQIHDPSTWPQQSTLARDGKWEELKKWQDELNKGRLE